MAGGKETPRQKMIGLMYLVLTAMLALNVSKQILQGYLSVNESLQKSKENIEDSNKRVADAFKNSIDVNAAAAPYYKQALSAQKDIQEAFKYLDDVKGNLIRATLGYEESVKVLGDTVNLRNYPQNNKIDDYDMPTTVLLGPNWEEGLKDGALTAKELGEKLTALHDKLNKQLDDMAKKESEYIFPEEIANLKRKIAIIKPHDSGREEDGIKFTWPLDNFYHLPMAAVFVNLNKMQVDLKNVEAEILQVFSAASGKVAIKFDQIKARVLASSSYVQQGGSYEADIFLGASSSSIKPEDMEILLGIDSAGAVAGKTGSGRVEVVNGEGHYKVTAGSVGDQKYMGVIKYKNPKGVFEYYPFAKEYKVAPASAAVAPDYMNVFYAGVVNPVTAQAAGVAPADLVLSANGAGAKVVQKSPGKYDFSFSGTGECIVTVSAKTPEGVKAQGPGFKFKVKPLPKPDLKVGGKFSPSEMKKDELATVRALGAGAVGFDFQANYRVVSWEISGTNNKGRYFPGIAGNGPTLSQEAIALLSAPQVNSKVYFEAKIQGPDGKVNTVLQSVKALK
jgi:gliding motility-associated protein GldM